MQRQFYVRGHYVDGDRLHSQTIAAWPFGTILGAVTALARVPSIGGPYRSLLRRRLEGLGAYWNGSSKPPAYDSYPARPHGPGGDQFYDDNAWFALALLDGYDVLHERRYFARAKQVFTFLASGWDRNPHHACPGGVFWTRARGMTTRNSVSTANAALVALRLYDLTHASSYLRWGARMWSWVDRCLTGRDGLVADSITLTGVKDRRAYSYNQGAMIASAALLYRATHAPQYLEHAETLARAAVDHFTAIRYADEPRTFVAILFRDLFLLHRIDPDADYRDDAAGYADDAWTAGRDSRTNLFAPERSQDALLDQAGMVELYGLLAAPRS
jgi:uncharacterized protein YyaL (SSP411 family)